MIKISGGSIKTMSIHSEQLEGLVTKDRPSLLTGIEV
jgi:hypothetical protein